MQSPMLQTGHTVMEDPGEHTPLHVVYRTLYMLPTSLTLPCPRHLFEEVLIGHLFEESWKQFSTFCGARVLTIFKILTAHKRFDISRRH